MKTKIKPESVKMDPRRPLTVCFLCFKPVGDTAYQRTDEPYDYEGNDEGTYYCSAACCQSHMDATDYEKRVKKLEDEGLTTSDALAIVDAEIMLAVRKAAPEMYSALELVADQLILDDLSGYSEEQRAVLYRVERLLEKIRGES